MFDSDEEITKSVGETPEQIILQRGLPFEVKIPSRKPVETQNMTDDQMNAELEKGYRDMKEGRVKPAREAFAKFREDYGL